MKKVILALILLIFTVDLKAQEVQLKKGVAFVDGKECLKYNGADPNHIEISTLDGGQTILLKFIRTGVGQNGGLYTKVIFVEQNKSFTSRSYIFTKKILINKLLEDGVIKNCQIEATAIDKFVLKYDEKVEDRLIRY